MDMDTEFYLHIGDSEQGPFGFAQLLEKGLTNDTLVWWPGAPNWLKASDVPELSPLLVQAAEKAKKLPPDTQSDTVSRPKIFCPYCGEEILAMARKCRYCGEWLQPAEGKPDEKSVPPHDHPQPPSKSKKSVAALWIVAALALLTAVGLMIYLINNEGRHTSYVTHEDDVTTVSEATEAWEEEEEVIEEPVEVREEPDLQGHPLLGYGTLYHEFEGYMPFGGKNYPIKVTFTASNGEITNVVYTNVTYGGTIRMTCTSIGVNEFTLSGKDGSKDFVMYLTYDDDLNISGEAIDGDRQLQVYLHPTCYHNAQ